MTSFNFETQIIFMWVLMGYNELTRLVEKKKLPKKTFSYEYILEQFFLQLVIIMLIVAQVHDMFFPSSFLNKYEFLKMS
jgi:hypothetical protein